MDHSLHRLTQLSRDSGVVVRTISSAQFPELWPRTAARRWQLLSIILVVVTVVLLWPIDAFAQNSPWERAASNLEFTFTGPLARSLALVSIVIGGLMFMFGEGGAKRQISGIVFGGGLALFATQFMTWLF